MWNRCPRISPFSFLPQIAQIDADIAKEMAKQGGGDKSKLISLDKDKRSWLQVKQQMPRAKLAWQYGTAKGFEADALRGYKYMHNQLLSDAEQRAVFDDRGLDSHLLEEATEIWNLQDFLFFMFQMDKT